MGKSCSIGTIFWFIILVSCGAGLPGWILFFTVTSVCIAVFAVKSYIKDKKSTNGRDFDKEEAEFERLSNLYERDKEAYKMEIKRLEEERRNTL